MVFIKGSMVFICLLILSLDTKKQIESLKLVYTWKGIVSRYREFFITERVLN